MAVNDAGAHSLYDVWDTVAFRHRTEMVAVADYPIESHNMLHSEPPGLKMAAFRDRSQRENSNQWHLSCSATF